jgi:AcrR family transcriptional regulator
MRGQILECTLALLEETGDPATVTIARVVSAAGCSPPTLYHYWDSRDDLLREAAQAGWAEFGATQVEASPPVDPFEEIAERGRRYLRFALERPGLFKALFLERAGADDLPERQPEPGPVLGDLIEAVGRATRESDPLPTALALWSAVHGVATLAVTTPMSQMLARAIFERQQALMIEGIRQGR